MPKTAFPSHKMLPITLILQAYSVWSCPTYSCASLPSDICANRTNPTILEVSPSNCQGTKTCSLLSVLAWTGGKTANLTCESTVADSGEVGIPWTYAPCVQWREAQDWQAGGTLLLCSASADCMKKDNSLSPCICTARSDSKGICFPDPSNLALFSPYWEACASGPLQDQAFYLYWAFSFDYWAYLQSDLSCIGLFAEAKTYQRLLESTAIGLELIIALLSI